MHRLCIVPLLLMACQTPHAPPDFDVLIRGGLVYDGTLHDGVRTNIGLRGGRIATVAADANATAARIVDARGLIVVPGFIDPHTHATNTLRDAATNANLNYLAQGVTTVFIGNDGYGVGRRAETFEVFESQGIGTNVAWLAGHGAIRRDVVGRADRSATDVEIAAMQRVLVEQMAAGAFGLSTGLFYAPGSYADTEEILALARAVADHGGIYDTHLRSESSYGIGLFAALDEAIRIARDARVPLHISHIKVLGRDLWGQSSALIEVIEQARAAGIDVTANQYPWSASGTRFSNALVPRWVMADSTTRMHERLADPELLPGIREEMQRNLELRGGADAMLVSAADSRWRGRTLAEIATAMETDVLSAAIRVIVDGDPSIASFVMHEDDIATLAIRPWVMTGSDGSSGHPRLYGTYPKAWEDFVRSGMMSVSQFVHRSSGLVATTFGLCDRGFIRDGFVADVAIIDSQRFSNNANYQSPMLLSDGVRYLIIDGVIVLDDFRYNGALEGAVLRHGPCDD